MPYYFSSSSSSSSTTNPPRLLGRRLRPTSSQDDSLNFLKLSPLQRLKFEAKLSLLKIKKQNKGNLKTWWQFQRFINMNQQDQHDLLLSGAVGLHFFRANKRIASTEAGLRQVFFMVFLPFVMPPALIFGLPLLVLWGPLLLLAWVLVLMNRRAKNLLLSRQKLQYQRTNRGFGKQFRSMVFGIDKKRQCRPRSRQFQHTTKSRDPSEFSSSSFFSSSSSSSSVGQSLSISPISKRRQINTATITYRSNSNDNNTVNTETRYSRRKRQQLFPQTDKPSLRFSLSANEKEFSQELTSITCTSTSTSTSTSMDNTAIRDDVSNNSSEVCVPVPVPRIRRRRRRVSHANNANHGNMVVVITKSNPLLLPISLRKTLSNVSLSSSSWNHRFARTKHKTNARV